jgi:acetyl esterase/lipase
MKTSFTYFLVALVLKLKGVKKTFSKSPINYKKLRKEDVKNPKGSFYKRTNRVSVLNSLVTEFPSKGKPDKLLLYVHGGAFVSGPAQHHWDSLKEIYKNTNHAIWLCDYPKAPEHKITEISNNIDAIYNEAIKKYKSDNIIVLGDSVGGTLATALVQRLVKKGVNIPSKIILISPVMDATMLNPLIDEVDKKDIMLSKKGVLSAKVFCANEDGLEAKEISPINGSFSNFPEIILFLAENDITYPDQQLMIEKLKGNNIDYKVYQGKGMPHIWPLLPVIKEGKKALKELIYETQT